MDYLLSQQSSFLYQAEKVTLQNFSSPATTRLFTCEWWALPPQTAKPTTHTNNLRTAVGSEESRREDLESYQKRQNSELVHIQRVTRNLTRSMVVCYS